MTDNYEHLLSPQRMLDLERRNKVRVARCEGEKSTPCGTLGPRRVVNPCLTFLLTPAVERLHPQSPSLSAPELASPPNLFPLLTRRAKLLQQKHQLQQEFTIQEKQDYTKHHPEDNRMLKAVRRSIALPSLSISIPQGHGERPRKALQESWGEEEDVDTEVENERDSGKTVMADPLQKQVKFLAPEWENDISDESSICQSPSWEGYGQKKKEKKQEAERKKKEKEEALREAKAAKKRASARLSKNPPNSRRASAGFVFVNAERSMSDSLLTTRRLVAPAQSEYVVQNGESDRAESNGRLNASFNPSMSDTALDSEHRLWPPFAAGQSRQNSRTQSAALPLRASPSADCFTAEPEIISQHLGQQMERPRAQKTASMRPGPDPSPTFRPARSPRESRPPSASRTPMLRGQSITPQTKSGGFLQNASKMFKSSSSRGRGSVTKSPEAMTSADIAQLQTEMERGRPQDSYVRRQRCQSEERALASLADDQLLAEALGPALGPQRPRFPRRSSLTQEAKSVAMRLAGIKTSSDIKSQNGHMRSSSSVECVNFLAVPYKPPTLDLVASESQPFDYTRSRTNLQDNSGAQNQDSGLAVVNQSRLGPSPDANGIAEPSHSVSSSSKTSSVASSGPSKKGIGLRNAAKAALNVGTGAFSSAKSDESRPPVSVPPFLVLRARTGSQDPPGNSDTTHVITAAPSLPKNLQEGLSEHQAALTGGVQTTENRQQQGVSPQPLKSHPVKIDGQHRISEGSTTSSAYDEVSPFPSPVTTPDTSRPQSLKSQARTMGSGSKRSGKSLVAHDDKTPRRLLDLSPALKGLDCPRDQDFTAGISSEVNEEERWSRTTLPPEVDFDAQSFVTSVSQPDHLDGLDDEISKGSAVPALVPQSFQSAYAKAAFSSQINLGKTAIDSQRPVRGPGKRPGVSKSCSSPDVRASLAESSDGGDSSHNGNEREMWIPARSPKRRTKDFGQGPAVEKDEQPKQSPIRQEFSSSGEEGMGVGVGANKSYAERRRESENAKNSRVGRCEGPAPARNPDTSRDPGGEPGRKRLRKEERPSKELSGQRAERDELPGREKALLGSVDNSTKTETEISHGSAQRSVISDSVASSASSLPPSKYMSPRSGPMLKTVSPSPVFLDIEQGTQQSSESLFDAGPGQLRQHAEATNPPRPVLVDVEPSTYNIPLAQPRPRVNSTRLSRDQSVPCAPPIASTKQTSASEKEPVKSQTQSSSSQPAPSSISSSIGRSSAPALQSILKQPCSQTRPPSPGALAGGPSASSPSLVQGGGGGRQQVLSALPKHMQVQAGHSPRPSASSSPSSTPYSSSSQQPIAKMFVECCSCKFYHDMPSKVYACMAKPDAVVEDRALGISGAIITAVRCPWCQHSMSTRCCAGYAAVVYLKEKLH